MRLSPVKPAMGKSRFHSAIYDKKEQSKLQQLLSCSSHSW